MGAVEMAKRARVMAGGLVVLVLVGGCGQGKGRSASSLSGAAQATTPAAGAGTVGAVSPGPSSPGRAAMALDVPAAGSGGPVSGPQAALNRLTTQYGPYVASSGAVKTSAGLVAVVAHSSTGAAPAVIEVLGYRSGHWVQKALFTSPLSVAPLSSSDTPIVRASLTAANDFVVYTLGADFRAASVVSDASGQWRMVPFSQRGLGSDLIAPNVSLKAGYLTSVSNECRPTCATSSSFRTTNFSYNRSAESFIPLAAI
jgi:hypothetical protein